MNAKVEFIQLVDRAKSNVICAEIGTNPGQWDDDYEEPVIKSFNLKLNYSGHDYSDFLKSLDFNYDNGYGRCEMPYGTVWFRNGSWAVRKEYDGSEWWSIESKPEIPDFLR